MNYISNSNISNSNISNSNIFNSNIFNSTWVVFAAKQTKRQYMSLSGSTGTSLTFNLKGTGVIHAAGSRGLGYRYAPSR
jgi:hypothetical protein